MELVKRQLKRLFNNLSSSSGLKYVIFRYFNVAGADIEAEIGEFHKPETHLIPLVLDVIAGKKKYITIFGNDYKTIDGTCVRDYVHVSDLVDAHILGLQWLIDNGKNRIYNLGTEKGFSVRQVIECCQKVTNKTVSVIEGKRRPGDCDKLVSSSALVRKELGWSPHRSELKQMIKDSWRWHQIGLYLQ